MQPEQPVYTYSVTQFLRKVKLHSRVGDRFEIHRLCCTLHSIAPSPTEEMNWRGREKVCVRVNSLIEGESDLGWADRQSFLHIS
jgi:predicted Rdx family selenoprotein